MPQNSFKEDFSFNNPIYMLRFMKLLFILSFVCVISIHAETIYSQETTLSIEVKNRTVQDILFQIEKESGYIFIFNNSLKNEVLKKTDLKIESKSLTEALNVLSEKTGLDYEIIDKQIVIYKQRDKKGVLSAVVTGAQRNEQNDKITVKGNLTDLHSNPLIGATVVLKDDPSKGTVTDLDGNYEIVVPDQYAILRFSYLGYIDKEEAVGKRSIINVILHEDIGQLEEVVVVGYGVQKKESVIGAIASIPPKRLQTSQTRAISNSMAGVVPGIISVQRTGELGNDQSEFYIRGMSTFSQGSRTPLVLVDGIERDMNTVSPEEIESFSILKDAAATAVYGVRGANGAILITTKKGVIGKPKVTVRMDYGLTNPTQLPKFVEGVKYMQSINEATRLDDPLRYNGHSDLLPYSEQTIYNTSVNADSDLYPNVDWMNTMMNDFATTQKASADVTGGTEMLRYRLMVAYLNEGGLLKTADDVSYDSKYRYNRYNVRSNIDMNLTPSTLLTFSVGGYVGERKQPGQTSGPGAISTAMSTPPVLFPVQYSTGEFAQKPNTTNPWLLATHSGHNTEYSNGIQSLVSLSQDFGKVWRLLDGLNAKFSFSFDATNSHNLTRAGYITTYYAIDRDPDGTLNLLLNREGDEFLGYGTSLFTNRAIYFELPIMYNKTINKIHDISGMILLNRRHFVEKADDVIASYPYRTQGLSGRATYAFDQRYFAEFNFGWNGSENFAPGYRYGFFPSFALGWMVSNERFMEDISRIITKLKLRGSVGKAGNGNIGGRRFAYQTLLNTGQPGYSFGYLNGPTSTSGISEAVFGIQNLSWEISNKMNVGFELGIKNDFNFTIDIYQDNRSGIFMQRKTITELAGFQQMPWANFGKTENRGFDADANYNHSLNNDLQISFLGNFTFTKSKVTEDDESASIRGTYRSREGKPLNTPMLLIAERLFTEDDFVDSENGVLKDGIPEQNFQEKIRPGDIKYIDMNGDGFITAEDKTLCGNPTLPQILYGFGANIVYKKFDFGFLFQGQGKVSLVMNTYNSYLLPGTGGLSIGNVLDNVDDRWTEENPSQDVFWPRLSTAKLGNNVQESTWWQKNASYLRLKNAEIGYTPFKGDVKSVLRGARIYLRGTNLFCLSSFKLWDPELGGSGYNTYPMSKYMSVGFELNF